MADIFDTLFAYVAFLERMRVIRTFADVTLVMSHYTHLLPAVLRSLPPVSGKQLHIRTSYSINQQDDLKMADHDPVLSFDALFRIFRCHVNRSVVSENHHARFCAGRLFHMPYLSYIYRYVFRASGFTVPCCYFCSFKQICRSGTGRKQLLEKQPLSFTS